MAKIKLRISKLSSFKRHDKVVTLCRGYIVRIFPGAPDAYDKEYCLFARSSMRITQ